MPAYKSYVIQVQVGGAWKVHHEGSGWMQELVTLLGQCNPKQGRANNLEMGEVFASNTVGGGATRQFRLWCTDGPPQGAFNMQLDSSRCTSPQAVTVCNRGCNPM